MRKFVISEEILAATLNYLNTRPRSEVNNLCNVIEGNIKEIEEYNAQEIAKKSETERQNEELKALAKKKIIDEYLAEQEKEKRDKLIKQFNNFGLVGNAEELTTDCIEECVKTHIVVLEREKQAIKQEGREEK